MKKVKQTPKSVTKAKKPTAYTPLSKGTKGLILVLLMALSFGLYFQSLHCGYVLDDTLVFTENNFVKEGLAGIKKIFANDSFSGYFGGQKDLFHGARYRPLSLVTFSIEQEFFGTKATLSHLINILIYGLCCFLGFLTIRRLFREKTVDEKVFYGTAFITTVIFLFHPIHVEAVANVKGRDELMSLFFSLATLQLCLKYVDSKKLWHLAMVPLLFFSGLLSKENTITFAAIVPCALYLFRPKAKAGLWKCTAVIIITTVIYLIMRHQIIGYLLGSEPSKDLMNNSFLGMNSIQTYATIFYTLLIYLKLHIFPHPLTHDYYPYHIPIMDFSDWQVWLSIAIHLILIVLAIIWLKKRKKAAFGLFYYFAAMSIVSNLVFSIGTFMNERFAFAASLGLCIVITYFIKLLAQRFGDRRRPVILITVGLILLLLGFKTMSRVPDWESALTLNKAAIKVSKNSARANSFMSTALFNEFKTVSDPTKKMQLLNEAEPYARRAVQIFPSYRNGHLMKVGIAAEKHKLDNDLDALLKQFRSTIEYQPGIPFIKSYLEYVNRIGDKNKLITFYEDVGVRLLIDKQQKYKWALHYLNLAMQVDPNDPRIRSGLRKVYTAMGQLDKVNQYR